MSAEEVVHAIHTLHDVITEAIITSEQRQQADLWLRNWQQSSTAWGGAHQLLLGDYKSEVHQLAAITLRSKILYDFQELPPASHVELRDSLFQHLRRFRPMSPPSIVTSLALAVAALSVQMADTWISPVETIVQYFGQDTDPYCLLLCLRLLSEESGNRRILVDRSVRAKHTKSLQASAQSVILHLEKLRTTSLNEAALERVLECYVQWFHWFEFESNEATQIAVVNQCYELMGAKKQNLAEIASNCVIEVLVEARQSPFSSSRLLESALALTTSHTSHLALKALESEDWETASRLSRVYSNLGQALAVPICNFVHRSEALQSMIRILLKFTSVAFVEDADRGAGGVAEQALGFWWKLLQVTTAEKLQSHAGADDESFLYLREIFELLLKALIRLCEIPTEFWDTEEPSVDFLGFRKDVAALMCDMSELLSSLGILERILESLFVSTGTSRQALEAVQEAHIFAVSEALQSASNAPVPHRLFALLESLEPLLAETPTSQISCMTRIAAVKLVATAADNKWLGQRPPLVPKLVHGLGLLLLSCEHIPLQIAASHAFAELCGACSDLPELLALTPQLVEACEALKRLRPEVYLSTLAGVATLLREVPADLDFLACVESLCNPLVHSILEAKAADDSSLNDSLDQLAVIIKNLRPLKTANRRSFFADFVKLKLWPMMEALVRKYLGAEGVIEKAGRVLKHSMRCVEEQFKPVISSLTSLLKECSAVKLQSTFLYAIEWLIEDFGNDPEVLPLLDEAFQQLSSRGFAALKESIETNSIHQANELVEDCYGMFCRYLRFCPLVAVEAPSFATALECLRPCLYCSGDLQVASVVFGFIESILQWFPRQRDSRNSTLLATPPLPVSAESEDGQLSVTPTPPTHEAQEVSATSKDVEALVQEKVKPIFYQHLRDLLIELMKLIATVPPHYIFQKIEDCVHSMQSCIEPAVWSEVVEAAVASLAPRIVTTSAMADQLVAQLVNGGREARDAMDDIDYRCRQHYFRQRRGAAASM